MFVDTEWVNYYQFFYQFFSIITSPNLKRHKGNCYLMTVLQNEFQIKKFRDAGVVQIHCELPLQWSMDLKVLLVSDDQRW